MPTLDWLKKEFDYGYSSGEVLAERPDEQRMLEERRIGGSYRYFFTKAVLPLLKEGMHVLELGPGAGSWTRALLSVPGITVHTCDFQDVTPWLKPEEYAGRLICHQVTDNSFSCIEDESIDLFFSFGVLVHCNQPLIEEILQNALKKVKPAGTALHNYNDWKKLDTYGWEQGGIPTSFASLPDDQIWWPRNTAQDMQALAQRAGWMVTNPDMGYFKRDGIILLAKKAARNKTDIPEADNSLNLKDITTWLGQAQTASPAEKEIAVLKAYKLAANALAQPNPALALQICALAKGLKVPCQGGDILRAIAFSALSDPHSAYEAVKEELRFFPESKDAQALLSRLEPQIASPLPNFGSPEFLRLYEQVSPFTMLSPARLYALYTHAKAVCKTGKPGNFVECGVAGGGSSALLATIIKQYGHEDTRLFCCDSFSGMPPATCHDVHAGVHAEATGWGNGTCAAPESSLQTICKKLDALDRIEIVKGYFCDTLPVWKDRIGSIAFLHMDGDWYESTRDILINLYDNLLPKAYVQVDDYGYWEGCRKALHEFEQARGLSFALTKIDGPGVWFIKP